MGNIWNMTWSGIKILENCDWNLTIRSIQIRGSNVEWWLFKYQKLGSESWKQVILQWGMMNSPTKNFISLTKKFGLDSRIGNVEGYFVPFFVLVEVIYIYIYIYIEIDRLIVDVMDVLWIWEWKMVENWWNSWIFTWKAPSHKASLWMFDSTSTRSGSLGTVFDTGYLMNTDAGRNELATKTYDWLNDRGCCSQSRWNCDQRYGTKI